MNRKIKYKTKISFILVSFFIGMWMLKSIAKNYTFVVTASLPKGLYKLSDPIDIKVGDLVQFQPSSELLFTLRKRGYIPGYVDTLVKEVAADYSNREQIYIENTEIGDILFVGQKNYGKIFNKDSQNRDTNPLVLEELIPKNSDEFLLLTPTLKSYDSRYFGLVHRNQILKKAELKIKF